MAKLLSKRAIENVRALAGVAADEVNRYRIDCIKFEPSKIGMIGVVTDGRILAARKLEGDDFPAVEESIEGNFPDWRTVLPKVGDDAICFAVNPVLLIRALEAAIDYDGCGECEECGEHTKQPRAVIISIPTDGRLPIGLCSEYGRAIASVMRVIKDADKCREIMQRTAQEFAESKLP